MSYAKRAAPVLALAAVLIFWEAAVRLFQIPLYVLPSPTEVLNALISDRLTLFSHSVITVAEALLGHGHFSGSGSCSGNPYGRLRPPQAGSLPDSGGLPRLSP